MNNDDYALLTDLYQLTMAQGIGRAGNSMKRAASTSSSARPRSRAASRSRAVSTMWPK